ncbi:MAG: RNA polymerase sigma factor [Sandaracinaceae bacterium]
MAGGGGPAVGASSAAHRVVADACRDHWARLLASLIGELRGDFTLAEEALQEAFAQAVARWPEDGAPDEPAGWLRMTARRRAIDGLRRRRRLDQKHRELLAELDLLPSAPSVEDLDPRRLRDDRLRLLFTCCHPALAMPARVALTLRTLCGLTTEEIARAFLVETSTMAQRLVRAKRKIRAARIPYEVPGVRDLPERLAGVLAVVYLVFNEGYSASSGDDLVRPDLCHEAVRLARVLAELLPEEPEVLGLLALLRLHDARRAARVDADGDLVLLEDQDRAQWDRDAIEDGARLVEAALVKARGVPGPYAVQAAIAALHAQARSPADTDWAQIAALYHLLRRLVPSPVVELNAAVAVAMARGPEIGLARIEALGERGTLEGYAPLHAARADLLRRLGRSAEAADAYRTALARTQNAPEARFYRRRLRELAG